MSRTGSRSSSRTTPLLRTAALVAMLVVAVALPAAGQDPTTTAPTTATPAHEQVVDLTYPTDPDRTHYSDSYAAGRSGGRVHKATDIMGEKLLPIYAAVGGRVVQLKPTTEGWGYAVGIAGDDGRYYSYLHINNDTPGTDDGRGTPEHAYAPGLALGSEVARGELIAFMGDSGNAEGTSPHLHLSITDPDVDDPYGTNTINPYFSLLAAEAEGDYATDPGVTPPAGPAVPAVVPVAAPDLSVACPPGQFPTAAFSDVGAANPHSPAVDCLAWREVTFGVGGGRYDPEPAVTRVQMASFTARLLASAGVALPTAPEDHFDDDDGSVHETAVNQLVELEIITGDTGESLPGRDFEGEVAMKRDRMAAWMVRTYTLIAGRALPPPEGDHFPDDAQHHEDAINRLAQAGIVQGTDSGRYEPRSGVRRDQMASYLARTADAALRPA
jgi:hypothetical protein